MDEKLAAALNSLFVSTPQMNFNLVYPPPLLFSLDELRKQPSVVQMMNPREISRNRAQGAQFIAALGWKLEFPGRTVATAQIYFQQFWMYYSMLDYPFMDIALTSLLVASKAEETYMKIKDFLQMALRILSPELPIDHPIEVKEEHRQRVTRYEFDVLKAVNFRFYLKHAYLPCLHLCMEYEKELGPLRARALSILDRWYQTVIVLCYGPNELAVGALYHAIETFNENMRRNQQAPRDRSMHSYATMVWEKCLKPWVERLKLSIDVLVSMQTLAEHELEGITVPDTEPLHKQAFDIERPKTKHVETEISLRTSPKHFSIRASKEDTRQRKIFKTSVDDARHHRDNSKSKDLTRSTLVQKPTTAIHQLPLLHPSQEDATSTTTTSYSSSRHGERRSSLDDDFIDDHRLKHSKDDRRRTKHDERNEREELRKRRDVRDAAPGFREDRHHYQNRHSLNDRDHSQYLGPSHSYQNDGRDSRPSHHDSRRNSSLQPRNDRDYNDKAWNDHSHRRRDHGHCHENSTDKQEHLRHSHYHSHRR